MTCKKYIILLKNVSSEEINLYKIATKKISEYVYGVISTKFKETSKDIYNILSVIVTSDIVNLKLIKLKINGIFKEERDTLILEESILSLDILLNNSFHIEDNEIIDKFFFGNIENLCLSDSEKFNVYKFHLLNNFIKLSDIKDLNHLSKNEIEYSKIQAQIIKNLPHKMYVMWISGPSNTGKSTIAKAICISKNFSIYNIPNNIFLNNNPYKLLWKYNGEDCVIWDDYTGSNITFSVLYNLLNNNGILIKTDKNKEIYFKPKLFIIISETSLSNISKIYNEEKKNKLLPNEGKKSCNICKKRVLPYEQYIEDHFPIFGLENDYYTEEELLIIRKEQEYDNIIDSFQEYTNKTIKEEIEKIKSRVKFLVNLYFENNKDGKSIFKLEPTLQSRNKIRNFILKNFSNSFK